MTPDLILKKEQKKQRKEEKFCLIDLNAFKIKKKEKKIQDLVSLNIYDIKTQLLLGWSKYQDIK